MPPSLHPSLVILYLLPGFPVSTFTIIPTFIYFIYFMGGLLYVFGNGIWVKNKKNTGIFFYVSVKYDE